jgi:predicted XRE-type DNA-binding protein
MSKDIFQDFGFNEEVVAGLKLKSCLFMKLQKAIRDSSMTQKKIAQVVGAKPSKIPKILNGKFNEFSIERIITYIHRLGYDIHIGTLPTPSNHLIGTIIMDKSNSIQTR